MAYDLDPSRIVDIAREVIVFDSIDDINKCLAAIAQDDEVCLRVTRSMLPSLLLAVFEHGRFVPLQLLSQDAAGLDRN